MAERPALFNTPMVRANRAGLKWKTRRTHGLDVINRDPDAWSLYSSQGFNFENRGGWVLEVKPQFGEVGDTIWTRETWAPSANGPLYRADPMFDGMGPGDFAWRWKPSIHMPRWASRDSYVITDVRVERLKDITEEDADAEGADTPEVAHIIQVAWSKRDAFAKLWEHINGPGSWDRNPWVWVYTYDNPVQKGVVRG